MRTVCHNRVVKWDPTHCLGFFKSSPKTWEQIIIVEFWFSSCLFHPRGMHTFTLNIFFVSDKLKADERERREANACVALHQVTEHGRNELQ